MSALHWECEEGYHCLMDGMIIRGCFQRSPISPKLWIGYIIQPGGTWWHFHSFAKSWQAARKFTLGEYERFYCPACRIGRPSKGLKEE